MMREQQCTLLSSRLSFSFSDLSRFSGDSIVAHVLHDSMAANERWRREVISRVGGDDGCDSGHMNVLMAGGEAVTLDSSANVWERSKVVDDFTTFISLVCQSMCPFEVTLSSKRVLSTLLV